MLAYEHRKQHEASVLVDHLNGLSPLLFEHFEPEAVHRGDLHIEQAVGLKVSERLLLRHQRVLIGHQNKRLTSVFPYTVIDETLLIDILPARKQSQHLSSIRLPTPRPVRAWRGRRRRCRRPLPPQHCPPRHRCACPLPSCTAEIRNSLSGNPR